MPQKETLMALIAIITVLVSLFGCIQGAQENSALNGSTQDNQSASDASQTTGKAADSTNYADYVKALDTSLVNIEIIDSMFSPSKIIVSPGTTIVWTNKEPAAHKIKIEDFLSGNLNQGSIFQYKLNETGTYEYYCEIHKNMKGTIIVQ